MIAIAVGTWYQCRKIKRNCESIEMCIRDRFINEMMNPTGLAFDRHGLLYVSSRVTPITKGFGDLVLDLSLIHI